MISTATLKTSSRRLAFLDHPLTFTVSVPMLTALGAASTVIAPILLDKIQFGLFALLLSLFQYISLFDLGLSRLCDKWLTQQDGGAEELVGELLSARLIISVVLCGIAILSYFIASPLTAVAIIAGVLAMVSNGPISVYRARSQVAALTLSSFAMQFGMSLPRLAGLLIDGVRGCIVGCMMWFGIVGLVLHVPFAERLRPLKARRLLVILTASTPLFVLSTAWLMYQLANRWISWVISTPEDYGLFAFGANLVLIGLGIIGTVSQTYYPRHLLGTHGKRLQWELLTLGGLAAVGCIMLMPLCRYALAYAFPHFAQADASTAALACSGLPLCLSAWLIPLVIARTERPVIDTLVIFGTTLALLFGSMKLFYSLTGLNGQAWANTFSAIILLAVVLSILVTRQKLLSTRFAIMLLLATTCLEVSFGGIWFVIFH